MEPDTVQITLEGLSIVRDSLGFSIEPLTIVSTHSAPSSTFWSTEVISLVIAALAVIIGPVVSIVVSSRAIKSQQAITKNEIDAQTQRHLDTIKSEVRSKNRILWIQELRLLVATWCSEITAIHGDVLSKDIASRDLRFEKIDLLLEQIALMFKTDDESGTELVSIGRALFHEIIVHDPDNDELPEDWWDRVFKVREIARGILKTEWERVKNLE